ncbi:PHP domain protein [Nitrosococcus halophilus Nc 4]|uniref:DNA polymerase beta n=1 Tax=Nitrosococcus halophilus (strain Nc4) TaxID=472759 RepID=D5C3U4_NITHN|nr:DNA polymerase/3'-5' exonuclease PolX [Nitrosococcus halophilus]ADE15066.1 PHP domain protein [Nitrosococcus halophilus Nc 4]
MTIHNTEIAEIFNTLADLLEIEGANPFRVRAYRNGARTVGGFSQNIASLLKEGKDLTELPHIGSDLADKIRTIVDTGRLPLLEEVEQRTPEALSKLMAIPGLGAKRIAALHRELKVDSLEDLKRVIRMGKVRELEGFGKKTEDLIKAGIERIASSEKRFPLLQAESIVKPLLAYLETIAGIKDIEVAGSYRRRKETVGDLDILVTCKRGSPVMERFVTYEEIKKVLSQGETRATVLLRSGIQVDLRVVPQVSYGAALHYFTGSQAHNIAVRQIGVKKNLKINEYGVFKGEQRVAGETEQEIFEQVGLPYIEPELREDRGEIEAALQGALPRLITLEDIRGDLHCHTKATDGSNSLEEMAQAAAERGYEYLAITDHSKRVSVAHGLDEKQLARHIKEIDRLNKKLDGIVLLKSIELDILEDGALDLPDSILKELDLTVCAIHYQFGLPPKKQTERILRAMDNPYFNILAHPSGRLINEREPYPIDLERIMTGAKERGCFLEVNAQPARLDLTDIHCKTAKDLGLKVVISTDAHNITHLDYMRLGIGQARRGWLEPEDVLNTRHLSELKKLLKRN